MEFVLTFFTLKKWVWTNLQEKIVKKSAVLKALFVLIAVTCTGFLVYPGNDDSDKIDAKADSSKFQQIPVKDGDICVVCDKPLGKDGLAILYKGRRVPFFNREQFRIFLDNPAKYFSKLQARAALFDEGGVAQKSMQLGWLLFGVWVTIALLCGAISAGIALRKGLPPVKWFFIGLIASVIGLIFAVIQPAKETVELPEKLGKISTTPSPRPCPKCGETNHPTAKKCAGCGTALTPSTESEVHRALN